MEFRRLRLAGFKSFVEGTELRIEPGLTGVVGPNGCGKSNLLEAIRWVMGEGSPKSLRSGGMDDVIFAGTAARPSRDFAEVMLSLDNSARTAPAGFNDADDLEVVRRIERGLGSAYRLNGRDVRQRDIQMLFADNATGAHSPALVSQGRIGAIIAAKPDERRALLEEAAGIAGLHVRRKEAEIRLRAAEANLLRLDDVLKAQEAQVQSLRRQARAAARYTEISARIRVAEAALLFARWQAAAQAADVARGAALVAEAAVTEATREVARLSTVQADASAALPSLRDAEARAAAALQHLSQQRSQLAAELARVEARTKEQASARDTGARDKAHEVALAGDAAAALGRIAEERARVEAARVEAKAALPTLAAASEAAERAATAGEQALSEAIERQARAAAQARAADAAIAAAEGRKARTDAEVARLTGARAALAGVDTETPKREAAAAAHDEAATAIEAATAALVVAEAGRRDAAAARDTSQSAAAAAGGRIAALDAEGKALARALAAGAGGGDTLLDRVTVTPGFEAAFAAALGDDLSAAVGTGPRRWAGAGDGAGDTALPAGAQPLSEVVAAPPEVARRLRQVGIIDDGDGIVLSPGQRLVTTGGRLWRWDGYRSEGNEGRAAAERLVQRARLAAIEGELPGVRDEAAAAAAAVAGAQAALAGHAETEAKARSARARAEQAQAAARAEIARADAAIAARAARLEATDAALTRLRHEAEGHAAEAAAARAAADEVTGLPELSARVATLRGEVEAARGALVRARAEHDGANRRVEADTQRGAQLTADARAWETRAAASAGHIAELDRRDAALAVELADLASQPDAIVAENIRLADAVAAAEAERRLAADRLAEVETALRTVDAAARAGQEALSDAREARARAVAQAEHNETRRAELATICGDRFQTAPVRLSEKFGFTPGELPEALSARFDTLTAERERIGPVNLRAETELAELEASAATGAAERADLETAIARLRGSIGSLNREGRVRLLEAFKTVDGHFRQLFGTLFEGGTAHLELTESDDPLAAGLEIMAQPPGKKLQSLTLLSGGEQALTAIALIFALFLTTPSPLCVLDEVDAPLDDANVERFCDLLDRMAATTATRFLIVTHNAVTMSRMHRLYGVTMGEPGVSQLVSVDLARAELLLNAA